MLPYANSVLGEHGSWTHTSSVDGITSNDIKQKGVTGFGTCTTCLQVPTMRNCRFYISADNLAAVGNLGMCFVTDGELPEAIKKWPVSTHVVIGATIDSSTKDDLYFTPAGLALGKKVLEDLGKEHFDTLACKKTVVYEGKEETKDINMHVLKPEYTKIGIFNYFKTILPSLTIAAGSVLIFFLLNMKHLIQADSRLNIALISLVVAGCVCSGMYDYKQLKVIPYAEKDVEADTAER